MTTGLQGTVLFQELCKLKKKKKNLDGAKFFQGFGVVSGGPKSGSFLGGLAPLAVAKSGDIQGAHRQRAWDRQRSK